MSTIRLNIVCKLTQFKAVPLKHSLLLGLDGRFSEFSYQSTDGKMLYLEEDCDAPIFVQAYRKQYGADPTVAWSEVDDKFIRNLPTIDAELCLNPHN